MQVPSAKAILSVAASVAGTAVLIHSNARNYVPYEIQELFRVKLFSFFSILFPQISITINEGEGIEGNQLFKALDFYLRTKISPFTRSFQASMPPKEKNIIFSMDKNQEVVDHFNGVHFKWRRKHVEPKSTSSSGDGFGHTSKRGNSQFVLSFHKKHRDMVCNSYLPHILSESQKLKEQNKTLKIHTLRDDGMCSRGHPWASANLDHPATFQTLAMELKLKNEILEDMEMFVNNEHFYRRVGKPWKRGYLLYGPPGTGKSSLIVAIANQLKFHIYELDLNKLRSNLELRELLFSIPSKSILAVEDIDCMIDLDRTKKATVPEQPPYIKQANKGITLSGLLNFIDGLWSGCGDERIIIFTTNHKERLDPALLRPGRMDIPIYMGYCTPYVLKMLVSNYTGIAEHPLFTELEQLTRAARVTPAEVSEQLMKITHEDPETVLRGLLEFIKMKKKQNELKASTSENSEIVEESEGDGANKHPNSNSVVICDC